MGKQMKRYFMWKRAQEREGRKETYYSELAAHHEERQRKKERERERER
jgi:hypothetical protein